MGKGVQKSETSKQAPTRKTKAAVDRRQSNRMLRQCPSGNEQRPQHHAITVPAAMQNSHKDNIRSSAVGKQLKQKSNSHFPALDFFLACVFLRVQLTSFLLISPGLCVSNPWALLSKVFFFFFFFILQLLKWGTVRVCVCGGGGGGGLHLHGNFW